MWRFSLNSLGSACVPEIDSERTGVGNSYGRMDGGVRGASAQASNLGLAGPRLDVPAQFLFLGTLGLYLSASLAVKLG